MKKPIPELGCSDHSCVFGEPDGMGTNGGCYCVPVGRISPCEALRVKQGIRALVEELNAKRALLEDLLGLCDELRPSVASDSTDTFYEGVDAIKEQMSQSGPYCNCGCNKRATWAVVVGDSTPRYCCEASKSYLVSGYVELGITYTAWEIK